MVNIRRAKGGEANILTNIAINSEAYWGYDEDYMENFKNTYRISESYISNYPTFLIEDNEIIVGFYGILMNEGETELEYFFIDTKYIGKGYGRLLWDHGNKSRGHRLLYKARSSRNRRNRIFSEGRTQDSKINL